jgi:hypothetical protein
MKNITHVLVGLFLGLICSSAFASNFIIARNSDGDVLYMRQDEALRYCKLHGSLLPSARDLALLTMSLGAKGIRDTAYPGISIEDPKVKAEITRNNGEGYFERLIRSQTGDLNILFYFSSSGYKGSKDFSNDWFWSSAAAPYNPKDGFVLNGLVGDLEVWGSGWGVDGLAGVACLSSRTSFKMVKSPDGRI